MFRDDQGAPVLVDPAAASHLTSDRGREGGMALRGDGGAGGAQSYAETHRRRKGVTPAMLQSERLLTDRGAYLSFLEVQLERVSAACLQVQGFDARIDGLSTQSVQNEEKLSNATKLVQLTQSYSEQQAAHFAERLAAMEGRTEGAASANAVLAQASERDAPPALSLRARERTRASANPRSPLCTRRGRDALPSDRRPRDARAFSRCRHAQRIGALEEQHSRLAERSRADEDRRRAHADALQAKLEAAAQDALSAREQAGDERRKATLRIEALEARR